MRGIARAVGAVLCVMIPALLGAQTLASRLVGEWTGTLRLDNSSPQIALEFSLADSTLSGNVFADGDAMGAMEQLTTRGDTVHFKVKVYDFTGVVTGTRMQVALIVFNGTTKTLNMVKTPPLHPTRGADVGVSPPAYPLADDATEWSTGHVCHGPREAATVSTRKLSIRGPQGEIVNASEILWSS